MRPLTFGVLVSAGNSRGNPAGGPALGRSERFARSVDGGLDRPSATELACSLAQLGHEARVIDVDADLDLVLRRSDVDACLLALTLGASARFGSRDALCSSTFLPGTVTQRRNSLGARPTVGP